MSSTLSASSFTTPVAHRTPLTGVATPNSSSTSAAVAVAAPAPASNNSSQQNTNINPLTPSRVRPPTLLTEKMSAAIRENFGGAASNSTHTTAHKKTSSSTTAHLSRPTAASSGQSRPRASTATTTASRVSAARASVPSSRRSMAPATTTTTSSSSSSSSSGKSGARPAWDLKGRVQDLEALASKLNKQLGTQQSTVSSLTGQLEEKEAVAGSLSEQQRMLKEEVRAKEEQFLSLNRHNRELMSMMDEAKMRHTREIDTLAGEKRELEQKLDERRLQYKVLEQDHEANKKECLQQKLAIGSLESQLKDKSDELARALEESARKTSVIDDLELKVTAHLATIAELEKKGRADEMLRRKLHNMVQELKGNIRVFCRMRPANGAESSGENFNFVNECEMEVLQTERDVSGREKRKPKRVPFRFDRVFAPETTQAAVFEEISQLVQSALDGYNTCIFAYGQTGSGKTYTMEGPSADSTEQRGMIPRAVEQIFTTARDLEEHGWHYEMEADYLEIYNDALRDLLAVGQVSAIQAQEQAKLGQSSKAAADAPKLAIRHEGTDATVVTNLTTVPVTCASQIQDLLKRAAANRSTAKTGQNDRSSRSHSVFRINIRGSNSITSEVCRSTLNLIDLAGSEDLSRSGAEGARRTETQNINKSLACLADVIQALANNAKHVPYRNSALTYLLQNSLGGNSKTLMFVNISPADADVRETTSSLRFATTVNSCEIGTAKKGGKIKFDV